VTGVQPVDIHASSAAVEGSLFVDDTAVASFGGGSATYNWDTTQVQDGNHSLQSKAMDAAGNIGESTPVTVTVNNRDTTAPTVSITYPLSGMTVGRGQTIVITADASDNVGVVLVRFYVNGSLVCSDTAAPYQCSWASNRSAAGKRAQIEARAFDAMGNRASSVVTVFSSKGS
jgi:chitinase